MPDLKQFLTQHSEHASEPPCQQICRGQGAVQAGGEQALKGPLWLVSLPPGCVLCHLPQAGTAARVVASAAGLDLDVASS